MVKLVFVDMDGTFLKPDKTISEENLRILDVAHEKGVQFVPCTGRNVTGIHPELLAHPSVKYAVCCNGALVVDAKSHETLHEVPISKETVLSLYGEVEDLAITYDVFADGKVFTLGDRWKYLSTVGMPEPLRVQLSKSRTRYDGTVAALLDEVGEVCRLNVFFHTDEERDAVNRAVDGHDDLLRVSSLPCNVEITNVRGHKGAGLTWLCDYLGVDVADTVAFGDSSNDLTMLEAAGDGVAMENAIPECKAAADHVCGSCEDSGVARYLEPLLG